MTKLPDNFFLRSDTQSLCAEMVDVVFKVEPLSLDDPSVLDPPPKPSLSTSLSDVGASSPPSPSAFSLSGRAGHTMTATDSGIYIIGGWTHARSRKASMFHRGGGGAAASAAASASSGGGSSTSPSNSSSTMMNRGVEAYVRCINPSGFTVLVPSFDAPATAAGGGVGGECHCLVFLCFH